MKKIIGSIIVIGLLLCISPISIANIQNNQLYGGNRNIQYAPHDSIYISSDNDFTQETGVVSGAGSIDDPYVISGWEIGEINVCGSPIKITKYFKIIDCNISNMIFLRMIEDSRCKIIENCRFTSFSNWQIYHGGYVNYTTIENCKFYYNSSGAISMDDFQNLVVRHCEFYGQKKYGIDGIRTGKYALIENCKFLNSNVGIYCMDYSNIRDCYFENSSDEGIVVRGNHIFIENCTFNHEVMGIEISTPQHNMTIRSCIFNGIVHTAILSMNMYPEGYSRDHIIENCIFKDYGGWGIDIYESQRIIIRNCVFESITVEDLSGAIELRDGGDMRVTRDCQIYNNYFLKNVNAIIIGPDQSGNVMDNLFYNNYFSGNKRNVFQFSEEIANKQQWNISKTLGTNIIDGPYLGGNYWDNYTGTDDDGDGLGNTPYKISDDMAWDYLPLFNPPPEIPIISGLVSGKTGIIYNYNFSTTDLYDNNVYYYVDWGDSTNSGWLGPYASGLEKTASHTWSEQGTYIIKIKAKDTLDAESDWATLAVIMPLDLPGSQQSSPTPQTQPSIQPSQPISKTTTQTTIGSTTLLGKTTSK